MSYTSTKLALGPVAWYRNDELSGDAMLDSSGNGLHQTYLNTDSILLGQLSGVETETSFSVYTPAERVANWAVASTPFDSKVTFTWEVLIKQTTDTLTTRVLIGRGNNRLQLAATEPFRVTFVLEIGVDDFTVQSSNSLLLNSWYHLIAVRNGSVMRLMINGVTVASRSDLPSSTPINVPGSDFIGYGATSGSIVSNHMLGHIEEGTFYNYAITEADGLAVYESMINAIFLNGRADAGPTAILRSEFEPDPIEFPWRHNWSEALIERISFRSAISQSVNGVEEGVSQRIAPRRELEFSQLIRDNVERRKLRAQLWANQTNKWFIPVRQYAERLLEPLSASAVITAISTAYKDYEIDGWIGFRQYAANGSVEHSEVRRITSLNPNSVEHEALVNSYVAYRSIVYPVRRALLRSTISGKGHTDSVEEWTITARLLPEDEALIPNRITTFSPTLKYRDVEVFDGQVWQSNDWSELREYEVDRAGEEVDFESGLISFESDTIGAIETFTYRMTLSGLDAIAQFLGWYYERVGALQPLWVPTMQEDFDIRFINTPLQQIQVSGSNYSDSYALAEPRRDIAFVYRDGSMEFRRVVAFEVFGDDEKLTLDAFVPTMTNLRCVSLLKYCRLDADQLELAWQTDQVVKVAWRFRELLHTPEGTGRSSLSPSASRSGSVSPSSSASPSASVSPSLSPSLSPSPSASISPSASLSPSHSASPSASISATPSLSPSPSSSESPSPSASQSPSGSVSLSPSPSASVSPSV